jgi:MFS family permease
MIAEFYARFLNTFRALKHRNFKLFFFGQCISVIGTWIQQIAISWLIYKLTNSAFLMGLITFAGSIPSLLVSPFAGVEIDRINKHKALVFVQSTFLLEAFALAIFTLTGTVNIWIVLVISIFMGVSNAIDLPLRQSLIIQLVEGDEDLSNAISLNSSSFNLARLVGPAIAGLLIAAVGEGFCFLLNAISYIAVIWALILIKIKPHPIDLSERKNLLTEFEEGFDYAYHYKPILYLILYIGLASLCGMAFQVIMPIFAKEVLGGDAQTLGYIMSIVGVGALAGAFYLSSRASVKGLSIRIFIASIMLGVGLIGLFFINTFKYTVPFFTMIGLGMVTIIAGCNTLIQFFVDEDKRGRVMSIYTMAFFGTVPLGSLLEGAIAEKLGAPTTFLINGLGMLLLAYWFYRKIDCFKKARP